MAVRRCPRKRRGGESYLAAGVLNNLNVQKQGGERKALRARWEALHVPPTFTPTPILRKETDLIRLPPPHTPSHPIPETALPRQPAIGRCKYRVLCPATDDATPSARRGPAAARAGTSVFTRGGPARAAAARRRRGGGVRARLRGRAGRKTLEGGGGGRASARGAAEERQAATGARGDLRGSSTRPRKTMRGARRSSPGPGRRGRAEPA